MSAIIKPGAGILFMKIGTHANEDLESIISRKTKEIEDTGYGMWGYGGNTCHPSSMVQPFAEIFDKRQQPIHLVMQKMTSRHFAEKVRADEFSADNVNWTSIPDTIHVLGSRFALVIKSLEQCEMTLPLNQTRVPVGRSMGRIGSRYLRGQADKACLEVLDRPEAVNEGDPKEIAISLVAELAAPYAVFLRNKT
jgi:hypothetical protein